ncbi:type VII secretion protein EccB [Streptomyces albogriseolus]|uniref:type VII secretion protein EccB n=1 Tax=Streptomyces TaxID=1883 RepID=UPI001F60314E|nr:type VII secretion protein EccB [Streptomyces sp. MMS20-AI2-20]MCI4146624.1 type VII secretion protein EccB [Streptomyces sp. MMS20-AI2-20]
MHSRRDQVQAHQFVVSRLTSGLLRADPDELETPVARTHRGMLIGLVVTLLFGIGFLVYGLVSPGGATAWKRPGTVVMEKETGTRYFYDGTLRAIRNYSSARLLAGSGEKIQKVSAASLRGTPHGSAVGIEGAPDALPAPGDLSDGPWEVCAATGVTVSGEREAVTSLVIDPREERLPLPSDRGVLVRHDSTAWLVLGGNRFRVVGGQAALDALGYANTEPMNVSAAFLEALPAGPDLVAPEIEGLGEPGPELDGRRSRVGMVFEVRTPGAGRQYYVLRRQGLVPVTAMQAALALGDRDTRDKAYGEASAVVLPLPVGAAEARRAPSDAASDALREAGKALPASPPGVETMGTDRGLCVRLTPDGERGTRVALTLGPGSPEVGPTAAPSGTLEPCSPVDAVQVAASHGSLVRVLGASGRNLGSTVYLVTDTGIKYRIGDADSALALGYEVGRHAQAVPAALLRMLPTGPDLSRAAAAASSSRATGTPDCIKPSG